MTALILFPTLYIIASTILGIQAVMKWRNQRQICPHQGNKQAKMLPSKQLNKVFSSSSYFTDIENIKQEDYEMEQTMLEMSGYPTRGNHLTEHSVHSHNKESEIGSGPKHSILLKAQVHQVMTDHLDVSKPPDNIDVIEVNPTNTNVNAELLRIPNVQVKDTKIDRRS